MTVPAPSTGPSHEEQDALDAATGRLLATVDALAPDGWTAPSGLPGWTRSHVLAHLALNAEGLTGVVRSLDTGAPATMYASDDARDDDIERLAAQPPAAARDRLRSGSAAFATAVRDARDATWLGVFQRTPGAPDVAAPLLHAMRHREVEIHHADLGLGYRQTHWPPTFLGALLDTLVVDRADRGSFEVVDGDGHRRGVGTGTGPTVHGSAADLAWWLLGRGSGAGLTSEDGPLPDLGAWRGARRP